VRSRSNACRTGASFFLIAVAACGGSVGDASTGASINGRLLAQTAVQIDASTVVDPAP